MNKTFEKICKMSQKNLKNHVAQQLTKTHSKVIVDDGFVYAPGDFPVLLVAHLDTVHTKLPNIFVYNYFTGSCASPNGVGGDDRCGVYMILKIIKQYNCSVLFCEDEEIGCIGANKFITSKLAKKLQFNYIIEFDRQGKNDAVFYECDNPEFEEFILKDGFYKTQWGSFTDISVLAPFFGCAAVNFSCGYYKPHTTQEYVVLPEMEDSIKAACDILKRTTVDDKFEYIEAVRDCWSYGIEDWVDSYDTYDDVGIWYLIEYLDNNGGSQWYDSVASSRAEAIGKFCISNPDIPYNNIIDINIVGEEYYN